MKKILAGLTLLALFGCSGKSLEQPGMAPLTETEVTEAMRDTLSRGIARAAARGSKVDGYLSNPQLKIELPEDSGKLQNTLRKLGYGADVDQSIVRLNRAAEKAAVAAKPLFIKTITSLDIDDAFELLEGESDAATQYLMDTSGDDLYDEFRPVISEALQATGANRAYADIAQRYNALPLVYDVDPEIVDYVTEKAIEGLFILMSQEEALIRTQASQRTSRSMKRVFGSLDS